MDDLLKRLASLDNATLSIYTLADPNYKKPRKPRTKRLKETTLADQINLPDQPVPIKNTKNAKNPEPFFNFDDWAEQFGSVCEADFQLSKMTPKELEELGYFENLDSDSETESHFNTDGKKVIFSKFMFLTPSRTLSLHNLALKSDSEIRNEWRESFFRTDRCKENVPNRVTTKYVDLFNQLALKNIFSANLHSSPDEVIKNKLGKYSPLITAKCFTELYSGVKDHVKNHLKMTESIFNEMQSIWSRARPYFPLTDLASDFRRLRNLKRKQADCSFEDVQEGFAVRHEVHEFLDKADVCVEIVREAEKRIGADKYGPTAHFAEIIDETNLSEEEESSLIDYFDSADANEANDAVVKDDTAITALDNNPASTDPSSSEISRKDIAKLHRAIKKAMKSKRSKIN